MAKQKTTQENPLATIGAETTTALVPSGGNYLRRVKLCAELTTEVKEKKAETGDFFLQGVENLGAEVVVVPVAARAHALRLKDGSSKVALESYDSTSADFQQIKADRDADPRQQEPNNMYGNDWLLYLPDRKEFVIYFLNKMAFFKADGAFVRARGKVSLMAASTPIPSKKNPKQTYRIPELALADDQSYDAPSPEEYAAARALFDNPRPQQPGDAAPDRESSPKGTAKAGGRKGR